MEFTKENLNFFRDYFVNAFDHESKTTTKVIAAVPDNKSSYKPDDLAKTGLELAWHLASADVWFLESIIAGAFSQEEQVMPANIKSAKDIAAWYQSKVPAALEKIKGLSPEKAAQPINFYGMLNYPAVVYLQVGLNHSIHHRGQLSTYLRPMGSKVPSIYGGSADEPFKG